MIKFLSIFCSKNKKGRKRNGWKKLLFCIRVNKKIRLKWNEWEFCYSEIKNIWKEILIVKRLIKIRIIIKEKSTWKKKKDKSVEGKEKQSSKEEYCT